MVINFGKTFSDFLGDTLVLLGYILNYNSDDPQFRRTLGLLRISVIPQLAQRNDAYSEQLMRMRLKSATPGTQNTGGRQ
jgi:hypothetical protein